MNTLQTVNQMPAMSSRQIASYTTKTHGHVKRDIESMLNNLGEDQSSFGSIYLDSMNREQTEYILDQRHTFCLIAKYNDKVRMRIIDRWLSLEKGETEDHDKLDEIEQKLRANLEESQALIAELRELSEPQRKSVSTTIVSNEQLNFSDLRPSYKAKKRLKGHSGTKGVNKKVSSSGKVSWHTAIGYNGEQHFIGYFDTYEEARAARLEAEKRLGVKRN